MTPEKNLNAEDSAVNLLDLPREVLCQALSLLSRPRDIVSSGRSCRTLLSCMRDAAVSLELSLPVTALRDPEQPTTVLIENIEKYMPSVCQLSLANVPLDDHEVHAVLSRLHHLTQLDLSGCRKLSSQIGVVFFQLAAAATAAAATPATAAAATPATAAAATPAITLAPAPGASCPTKDIPCLVSSSSTCPTSNNTCPAIGTCPPVACDGSHGFLQRPACRLQALNLQRCFQLNAGSLTQLLAAAAAGGGAPQLCCLAMSHLDLSAWMSTLICDTAPASTHSAASAAACAGASSGTTVAMVATASDALAGAGISSSGVGAGSSSHNAETAAVSDSSSEAARAASDASCGPGAIGNSMSARTTAMEGADYDGGVPDSDMKAGPTDGLSDAWSVAPLVAARLSILALHNCNKLTPGGVWTIAQACPNLQYLMLGGSSMAFDAASTEVLASAALREAVSSFVPRDLHELVAASSAVSSLQAMNPAGQALVSDTVAHLVALVAALPHLSVLEVTMMSPHVIWGVRRVLGLAAWCGEGAAERRAPAVWDFASRETLLAVQAELRAAECGRPAAAAAAAAAPPVSALRLAVKCAALCSNAARSTALHRAAERDDGESVRALLALGATADARDTRGATALFLAAEAGRAVAADVLLSSGADCTLSNTAGESPLYICALRGHLAVVRRLLEHCQATGMAWWEASLYGDKWTPLMAAAVANRHDIAALLLQAAGPSAAPLFIESTNRYGQSVMHIAARKGSPQLLRLLLQAGGAKTVLHADTVGDTPMDVAKKHRHVVALDEFSKARAILAKG